MSPKAAFWVDVFVAAIRAGGSVPLARVKADDAVKEYQEALVYGDITHTWYVKAKESNDA